MDNFKNFLQENKQELDFEKPDRNIWNRIEPEIELPKETKKVIPISRWMAAAACLLLVLASTYFFVNKNNKSTDIPTIVKNNTPVSIEPKKDSNIESDSNNIPNQITTNPSKINTETFAKTDKKAEQIPNKRIKPKTASAQYVIADVEVGNFSQIIEYQRQYISTLPIYGQQSSYFNDFRQQLKQMDADEKDVRNDIKNHGINNSRIELLINIYQQKIILLKQLSQEIGRVNKSYYQKHSLKDSVKTDNPHFLNL